MSEAPGSRAGSMFGPYRLKRALGRGGMGEVYEAEHTVKEWTVAVKLMSQAVSSDPVFRERMKREARIAGSLQEPHVVPIHDYGEIDGQMFLEMRLIEGTNLDTLIKRYGPLTPPRAVAIVTQIASALDAAHAAGVLHRDVKPPNILVTRDDFAYLVDFGIANATTDEKLTRMGDWVGTWKYMAPERFSNGEVTHRADVYALACVLYECLTGAPPYNFEGGPLVSAHVMDPIPRPSAVRSGLPKAFDAIIACGMAKRPEERYQSAGDLALAAHEALSTPDRNEADDIMRRSHESLPPGGAHPVPPTIPHTRPPAPQRPSGPAGPSGPSGPSGPQWAPSGPPSGLPSGHLPRPAQSSGPAWAPMSAPIPSAGPPPQQQNFHGGGWQRPPAGPPPGPPSSPQLAVSPGWNQPSRARNPWRIVSIASAVVAVLILVAIGIWFGTRPDDTDTHAGPTTPSSPPSTSPPSTSPPSTSPPSTSPPSTPPPSDALGRLMAALPAGYPSGTCTAQTGLMTGAVVAVKCGKTTDANGPNVSAYGLYPDVATLNSEFKSLNGTFAPQDCPGGGKSPGKWWHSSDPNTVLGQVACGIY
ncbi:serine/threonine-protein kinase, partial [Mycobacterium sp.]|uniref:serine/threonine-protein kinase n=1 Tax=Mycobacterium sp. TaxID=1785 RepID=UPI003C78AF9A